MTIDADARLYLGLFDGAEQIELALDPARKAYVHLIRGTLEVNGASLDAGDAVMMADEKSIRLANGRQAEVLVFDLAA